MTVIRATPYPGTPSETYAAGWCPGCGGTGRVHKFVPVEGTYVCSSCNGGGTREAMDAHMEAIGNEEAAISRCRDRLAEIDGELAELERLRAALVAEQDRLGLAIEAAKDPSVLNRRRKP